MKTNRWEVIVKNPSNAKNSSDTFTETKETKREAESRRDSLRANGRKANIRKQK